MRKNWFLRGMGMAIAVSMLSGCGGNKAPEAAATTGETAAQSSQEGTAAQDDSEEVTLRFSWWGGDSRHNATEKAIKAFEAKYPHIKVVPEYGAWTGWEEKQALNLIGGNASDVMQINWNWIGAYGQNGTAFVDLNQYSDVIDLKQFPENSLELCTVDGKLMAAPIAITGNLFFWNKTTFDEIGCPIPTDEKSFLAAGQAFKAYGDDYYLLAMEEYDRMKFMRYYLESVYGRPWVEDGKLNYSVEEIATGFDFIKKMEDNHVMPTLAQIKGNMSDTIDQMPQWINGYYAGMYGWDSGVMKAVNAATGSVDKPGQEFVLGDFVKFGDYNGGFTKISMCFAVPTSSKHPKEAAMLIDFLLNDPEGVEIGSTERGIPCSKKAVDYLNEKNIGEEMVKEANKKVIEFSKFPLDPEFENSDLKANPDGVYYKAFGKFGAGEIDSRQAAEELTAGINEVLGN